MKKILVAVLLVSLSLSAMAQGEISLPVPNKKVEMTLFDALQQRHSVRSYQSAPVGLPLLSQLLWAACGYNRTAQQLKTLVMYSSVLFDRFNAAVNTYINAASKKEA